MRGDEAPTGDERSLGDEGDARSVSTLDIADAAAASRRASETGAATPTPCGGSFGTKDGARRGSAATALQVEDKAAEEAAAPNDNGGGFQWDIKTCAAAFVVVSLLFVAVVVTLSFTLTKRVCELGNPDCSETSSSTPASARKG